MMYLNVSIMMYDDHFWMYWTICGAHIMLAPIICLREAFLNKGIIQLKCVLPVHQALCDVAHAQSQAVREAPESLQKDVNSN